MKLREFLFSIAGVVSIGLAGTVSAHHSYGMYDRQKEVTVTGTVKEFEWTNPHARVTLLVTNAQGQADEWDIEMGPPGQLVRSGWKRLSLRPGDKVDILMNPLKDGKLGGHSLIVTTPSGEKLYDIVFKQPPPADDAKAP